MEVVLLKIKNRFFQKINYKICAIFVFVFCCFIFSGNTAHAANRFWVGGTGNWSDATNHWASVSNGAPGAGNLPTASDNVFFDSFSGAGITTVDASVFTDDLDFTGYTGNFAGSQPLTISGSLTLGAGMTRTYTGIITFNATSSKTITSNNIILSSSINFNGAGGSWVFQDALNNNAGSILFNNGTLNTNGKTVSVGFFTSNTSNTRTLNMASSDIRIGGGGSSAWSFNITGLTFIAPAILRFNNTTSINLTTNFTYNDVIFNNIGFPGAQPIISGSNTFTNLTMNSWFGSNIASIYLSANQTITGTLTISGNSPVSRILVQSNTIGTPRTLTVGAVSLSNVDFMDIIGAGGASPFAGTSIGNSLGNTNITTTTPVTRYWVGNGGNWSSIAHWSATSGGVSGASVPLSQDSVIFDANSITLSSQTIITDMPRLSADLNFTGVLNNPALSFTSTDNTMYGSLTLSSGMTLTGNNSLIFSPRSSVNLTSAGRDFGSVQIYINAPGGSLTLQDNLVSLYIFHLDFGVFDVNNKNIRSFAFSSNTSNSRVLNMGSGVWTIYGSSGAVWNVSGSGITLNANTSTIKFSESSGTVNSKSFVGGGLTYNNIWFSNPTSGSSIGTWVVNGSNIFNDFKDDNTSAHTVNFTAGTTQTVNTFTVAGSAGNLITLNSSVNGSAWNLSKSSGTVSSDYLSIKDSHASGGASFCAGANSTNVSGNTGWQFSAYPCAPTVSTTTPLITIGLNSATLLGNITSTGGANVITTGFKYGTSSTLSAFTDVNTGSQNISSPPTVFSQSISGLLCSTTYYYQAYSTNSVGTGVGIIRSFTTNACDVTFPVITVNDGTSNSLVQSDIINLTAFDINLNTSSLQYNFSVNNICDSSDFPGTTFTNSTNFTITGNHTDYLCAKASDTFGNTTYLFVGQLNTTSTALVVSSVVTNPNPSAPRNDSLVSFIVTFDRPVQNVDAGDFTLNNTGVIGASITGVTGSGSSYVVTVNTGSGDGTIQLQIPFGATIQDFGNASLTGLPFTTGQTYIIDKTAPILISTISSSSVINLTTPTPVTVTAVFSESMNNTINPSFSFSPNVFTTIPPVFTFSSGAWSTTTLTNDTYTATYTLNTTDPLESLVSISVLGGKDLAGNIMLTDSTHTTPFTLDTIAPYIVSAQWHDTDNSSTITPGDSATLSFREPMNTSIIVNDSSFSLGNGNTLDIANAITPPSWTDASTLVVTFGPGSTVVSGDSILANSVFQDINGNPSNSTPPVTNLILDTAPPQVYSIVRVLSHNPTNSSVVYFTVTFSEPVSLVDASDFIPTVVSGSISGATVDTGITQVTSSIYTVPVNTGTGNGDLRLDVLNTSDIKDVGNNLLSNKPYTGGEFYTINKIAPTVTLITVDDNTISQSDDDSTVTLTLTFSSPMDQSVTPSIAFSPDVESSGILTFDNINSGWLSSTVYVAKYIIDATIPAELQNIIATISNAQDLASNPISLSISGFLFDVDTISPVISISSPSTTSTNSGPVIYTVTYSGANTVNLVNSDIVLNTTGTSTGTINVANGNTATPTITISNITGNGTLGISINSGTASDVAGNIVASAGPSITFNVVAITTPVVTTTHSSGGPIPPVAPPIVTNPIVSVSPVVPSAPISSPSSISSLSSTSNSQTTTTSSTVPVHTTTPIVATSTVSSPALMAEKINLGLKILSTASIAVAAIASFGAMLFANPLSLRDLVLIPMRLWSLLLTGLGLRRRIRPWGTVYDSVTKQPLDPVYVSLLNLEGKEVASCITDINGRYGFFVEPGIYKVMPKKTNYVFPSNALAKHFGDEMYQDLYFGDYMTIGAGEIIAKNIPMDPVAFDWNEFAKNKQKLLDFYSKKELWMARFSNYLFIFGFAVSLIALAFSPKVYNIIISSLYVIMFIVRRISFKFQAKGKLMDKDGTPLSFAIIRVFSVETNVEIAHKVADQMGRYYMILPNGSYYMRVEKKNNDGSYTLVNTSDKFEISHGALNKVFKF